MVAQSFRCDESRLKSFLDDELPDRENTHLRDHLETCAACRGSLERLAAGSRLWTELRRLGEGSIHQPGSDSSAADRDRIAESIRRGAATAFDCSLDFLVASDAPGSLGRLGPYEVTDVLGSGGFGVVLKAFDPALGRPVAIKVLAPHLATSAAARSRFAREARAAAAVVADHVVAIHAVDSWNGLPYLVMPYIAGCSLQERVDRDGPMNVKEVLRIGVQTAQGLAAAHVQGLVHRDVKPSNILLENGVERVKLTDFGLARAVDDASLTQSGVVAGTPQYMSPEQARGEAVDQRSDLFALGSVLYFMCVGHSPFRANSTPAVLRRVCDETPRPLSEINPDIPVWLAQFIARLHAKNQVERVRSAAEVAETLAGYLAALQRGVPIVAKDPRPLAPAPRRPARKAAVTAAFSIVVLALALGPSSARNRALSYLAALVPQRADNSRQTPGAAGPAANIVFVGQAAGSERIIGSGNSAVKVWDITDFTGVEISSTFRARIHKGTPFRVTTTADDNVLPFVRVSKQGHTMKVGLQDKQSYELKTRLEAEITLPTLAALDLSGASEATLGDFKGEKELKLRVRGSSKVDGLVTVKSAEFDAGGASSVSLAGSADIARISVDGASHAKLGDFLVRRCELSLEGASNAQLAVISESPFNARLAGASRLSGQIHATEVNLELEGASHVSLGGPAKEPTKVKSSSSASSAQTVKVIASGASHLDLAHLRARDVEIELSGASHANVVASGTLKYDLGSASHLTYRGEPSTVKGKKSGGSMVSHRR
jgi:serine/threonine-protein kinase